tara:strand:+ start:751 stop:1194 length:444 start_codon:yes stop_codon:yes gene_type:complete
MTENKVPKLLSLNDIKISMLKKINNVNGDILHILRKDDPAYEKFGEAYFTTVKYNKIKAWKKHNKMHMNLTVPIGSVKFVFYLDHEDIFREEEIGEKRYGRLTVPPGVWFGFKGMNNTNNLILNISSIVHDPKETDNRNLDEIVYEW